jgi:phage anti-repressor protein
MDMLKANFEEGIDFDSGKNRNQTKGRGEDRRTVNYFLTTDCFKSFCMMAGTDKGKEVRRYYLDIEKKYRSLVQGGVIIMNGAVIHNFPDPPVGICFVYLKRIKTLG